MTTTATHTILVAIPCTDSPPTWDEDVRDLPLHQRLQQQQSVVGLHELLRDETHLGEDGGTILAVLKGDASDVSGRVSRADELPDRVASPLHRAADECLAEAMRYGGRYWDAEDFAEILRPYLECAEPSGGDLRVALGRLLRERAEIEARADGAHDTGYGFIDFGDYIESVTGLDTATLRACIDAAKDADGVGGAS